MVRPHPVMWRLVHGVVVVYLLALVWLLFQDLDAARLSLKHLYPELGVDLGERAYGADCRLFTPEQPNKMANLWATIFDEFVLAHTFGWIAEALVLRHYGMLFTVSIMYELMELTFQHWLPNFNECWWDSWILDVALCNNLGIFLGMWLVKSFRGRKYHWSGISHKKTVAGKVARGLGQFLPYYFDDLQWQWMSEPSRLVACLICCAMNLQFKSYIHGKVWDTGCRILPEVHPLGAADESTEHLPPHHLVPDGPAGDPGVLRVHQQPKLLCHENRLLCLADTGRHSCRDTDLHQVWAQSLHRPMAASCGLVLGYHGDTFVHLHWALVPPRGTE